jgi:hypothetical protein
MISLIINTCAGRDDGTLSNAKQPHAHRAYLLRNFILPQYIADPYIDEVIVAGEWEEGEGYIYVPVAPIHRTWADTLPQRQAGFEASKGDILVFQHDDHVLDNARKEPEFEDDWDNVLEDVLYGGESWDVLSPTRYTRLRNVAGERLNDNSPGFNKYTPPGGGINGHCCIFRREVIEAVPWNSLPIEWTFDIIMRERIQQAGFKIVWTDAIRCYDCEMGAKPWL